MSLAATPAGARCALHPDQEARGNCPRCGAFMCHRCERRVRLDARPMCAACFELRERKLGERPPENPLARAALVIGLIGSPLVLAMTNVGVVATLAASAIPIAVSVFALRRPGGRVMAIAGLVLGVLALAGAIALLQAAA